MSKHPYRPAAVLCLGLALSGLAFGAMAQQHSMHGDHMEMNQAPGTQAEPSTQAYKQSMMKMMDEMNAPYTGNADKDFATQMLAHHKGAVDMAKVELKYGTDPEMRKLAEDIIKAQDGEIRFMEKWLAEHAGK